MKHAISLFFLAFYTFCVTAQSIAPDGDFDFNINGWHCGSVNPIWRSDDGSGLSGHGSLQMSHENFISNGGQLTGGTCTWVTVSPMSDYKFDGFFKIPSNSEFENILISFYWFTDDETFIKTDSHTISTNEVVRDTWSSFEMTAKAPANANKLILNLGFQFYSGGQNQVSAFLLWDDLYLINFIDVIFTNGFD